MTAEIAYLGLGSNLGNREQHLAEACLRLAAAPGIEIIARSSVEETEPVGNVGQGRFLNQMIAVRTELDPAALLAACQRVEAGGGRLRTEHWGPRTIDVDIVLFGDRTVARPELTIPHAEILNRDFWRRELAELQVAVSAGRSR